MNALQDCVAAGIIAIALTIAFWDISQIYQDRVEAAECEALDIWATDTCTESPLYFEYN